MNIVKFIRKQGKIKEADPKIFEEPIECEVRVNEKMHPIIPFSYIRSELIKCGFKAKEPNKFIMLDGSKIKKCEIDCFDTITFAIKGNYELKAVNFKDLNTFGIDETKDLIEYKPIEVNPVGHGEDVVFFTIFFGDFLKMVMLDQYYHIGIQKPFYDRLGDIPIFVSKENDTIVYRFGEENLFEEYLEVSTEKGDFYYINLLI